MLAEISGKESVVHDRCLTSTKQDLFLEAKASTNLQFRRRKVSVPSYKGAKNRLALFFTGIFIMLLQTETIACLSQL